MKLWALTLLAFPLLECNGANILAFLPMPYPSHQYTFRPILRELTKRGHNVTLVTTLPDDKANYSQIILESPIMKGIVSVDFWNCRKDNWRKMFALGTEFVIPITDYVLRSPQVQQLIHSYDLKFDLVLTESTLLQSGFIAIAHRFNAPTVEITTFPPMFWLNYLLNNPSPLSYRIDYLLNISDKMNFWERLENVWFYINVFYYYRCQDLSMHQLLVDKHLKYPGWETRPSLIELLSNISLAISSSHIAINYPYPNNPNIIEVAGIQIQSQKDLPQDLQTFMDNASEGVIYFSFGTLLNSSAIPEATKQAFISAFAKLPYKILWKWEADSMPNKPANVKLSKWFPQRDLLTHKNIKGFITHCGLNSVIEAVYIGVPMVAIPIFADQYKNSKQVESAGYGLVLDFDNITEKSVLWAISEMTKSSYVTAAKKQSDIFRDNPKPPLDTAVYWIEYVIRHKGAAHLRTAAASLSWYQYFLLDVIGFIIMTIVIVLLLAYLSVKAMFGILCRRIQEINNSKKDD